MSAKVVAVPQLSLNDRMKLREWVRSECPSANPVFEQPGHGIVLVVDFCVPLSPDLEMALGQSPCITSMQGKSSGCNVKDLVVYLSLECPDLVEAHSIVWKAGAIATRTFPHPDNAGYRPKLAIAVYPSEDAYEGDAPVRTDKIPALQFTITTLEVRKGDTPVNINWRTPAQRDSDMIIEVFDVINRKRTSLTPFSESDIFFLDALDRIYEWHKSTPVDERLKTPAIVIAESIGEPSPVHDRLIAHGKISCTQRRSAITRVLRYTYFYQS